MEFQDCNLTYEFDGKLKYVKPDKRVLVYQPKLEVPKRFKIPSAVFYTIYDLLLQNELEKHLDNILYIFNEAINLLRISKARVTSFNNKTAYNSYSELDELGHFYSVYRNQNAELIQITFKSNLKGRKHDITIKSKELINNVLKTIAKNIGNENWTNTTYYESKKMDSDNFIPKRYNDFFEFTCCKYLYTYFKKNCKQIKKYKAYFLVGQFFVVLNLLDSEQDFNLKNDHIYNYTNYYKYLTDNIRNCLNRMPVFYKND